MATTEINICNLALGRVGSKEIGSLTEQSKAAERCRVFYPQARDTVLSLSAWSFARTTKALGLLADVPAEWDYGYGQPSDCLKVLYIVPEWNGRASPESVFGSSDATIVPYDKLTNSTGTPIIVTNKADAVLAYIKKITDVRLFTEPCVEAIAWRLAMDLAIPLGGDAGGKYRTEARAEYTVWLNQAQAQNSNERWPRQKQQLPRSIQARGGRLTNNNGN